MNGTQKRTLVSALYVLWHAKRHLSGQATLNSERIKPIALAIIKLFLSEDISQSVRQSVSQSVSQQKTPLNKKILKFRSNLLKAFWVDQKACLGLVLLTNAASSSSRLVFG